MRRAAANNLKTKAKKQAGTRMSARQVEIMNDKYLGEEPTFANDAIETRIEYIRALNWYSSRIENDQGREWLIDYIKTEHPKLLKAAKNVEASTSMCWIARMYSRGLVLPHEASEKWSSYIDTLTKWKQPVIEKMVVSANNNEQTQDRIHLWMPDFEEALDNLSPDFDTYIYLSTNNVPQVYATRIAEFYQRILNEVTLALTKKDKDVVEAYSHMKKSEIAFLGKYLLNIIDDCSRYVSSSKKERAPRKTKSKSPDQLLKHFTYMPRADNLKIVSSDPKNILGSTQLFAFNTAYNILTMYVARDSGGLGVHRTAITNYDETRSKSKRVGKKFQLVIDTILQGSKKARDSVFDLSSTDYIKVGDRINSNVVLLKIVK